MNSVGLCVSDEKKRRNQVVTRQHQSLPFFFFFWLLMNFNFVLWNGTLEISMESCGSGRRRPLTRGSRLSCLLPAFAIYSDFFGCEKFSHHGIKSHEGKGLYSQRNHYIIVVALFWLTHTCAFSQVTSISISYSLSCARLLEKTISIFFHPLVLFDKLKKFQVF